jgi:hypothetical protein
MTGMSDERLVELLRLAKLTAAAPPAADLWPRVRARLDQRPAGLGPSDWVLVISLVALCLLRPALASVLLIHF